jgi:hypothetical protein
METTAQRIQLAPLNVNRLSLYVLMALMLEAARGLIYAFQKERM